MVEVPGYTDFLSLKTLIGNSHGNPHLLGLRPPKPVRTLDERECEKEHEYAGHPPTHSLNPLFR